MKQFVTDTRGQRYLLTVLDDSDDLFWVRLSRKGDWVGEAKCPMPLPNTMANGDIHIRDDSDPPRSYTENWLRGDWKSRKSMKCYRHIGLGTKLLKLVIQHARMKLVKYIYGSITQEDINRTPRLLQWYEKHGFKKCGSYPGCIKDAFAWICMELD